MKQFLWLLTAAVVLSACTSSPSPTLDIANGAAPVISRFGASPTSGTAPLAVRFFWSISDANRDLMSCELDVAYDGQNFSADYSVGLPRTRTSNCTSSSRINHTFGPGIHNVALRVCDGANCTIRTQVITANPNPNNRPPVIANFVANPNPVQVNNATTFSWTVSDPNLDPLTCTFDPDTSTSGNETTVPCNQTHNHTYTSAGTFTARLSVSDGVNPPVGANVSVSVINNPPLLSGFAASPNPVQVNNATTFSWTVSDPNLDPLTCTFDPDTSTSGNETTVPCNQTHNHTYTSAGTFTARLSVSDGVNAPVGANVSVSVINNPPLLSGFAANPNPVGAGLPTTFSWTTSDPENSPITCTFDPDTSTSGNETTVPCNQTHNHTYTSAGTFTAQLSVSDGANPSVSSSVEVEVVNGFTQISAGENHTCALTSTGNAYCWGRNQYGQLGNGNNSDANTPQAVAMPSGITLSQISSGYEHTCALTPTGQAYCWGRNVASQLGNGTRTDANTPQAVAMPSSTTFSQISSGEGHTCALTPTGQAYCWGWNGYGQLGNGTSGFRTDANTPQVVLGGHTFSQISAGSRHSCAVTSSQAYCWGYNIYGQLGNGNTGTDANTPQLVSGSQTFSQISGGGQHTCALTTSQAYCWGWNLSGQLGTGNNTGANTPQAVSGVLTFSQISGGENHTCALTSAGQAYCWGLNNGGQLGTGNNNDYNTPQAVAMPSGITFSQISGGEEHTCALTSAGQAYCWGNNLDGQLGDGNTGTIANIPQAVPMPSGITFSQISSGGSHTCALTPTGQAYCWGRNSAGQLGTGNYTNTLQAVNVASLPSGTTFGQISGGSYLTCALTSTNQAYCWGQNVFGELGNGSSNNTNTPQLISGHTFSQISSGYFYTCALTPTNQAYCWGNNSSGQLGTGNNNDYNTPQAVLGGHTFSQVSTGGFHTCALTSAGQAYCWGWNGYGQLGNGNNTGANTPQAVVMP